MHKLGCREQEGKMAVVPRWSRPRRRSLPQVRRFMWVMGLAVVLGAVLRGPVLWGLAYARRGDGAGIDFSIFVQSGRALARDANPYATFAGPLWRATPWTAGPNLNPPVVLLLLRPLASLAPYAAFHAWQAISLLCYLAALLLLARAYPRRSLPLTVGWAVSLFGLWQTIFAGNLYLPLVLVCTGAWLLLARGHPRAACVLIGVAAALKPQLLVWLVLLALTGTAGPALLGAAVFIGLWALPVLVFGPAVYTQWLTVLPGPFVASTADGSLIGVLAHHGLIRLGAPFAVALLGGLAFVVRRRRPDPLTVSGLGLVAALLASPITWAGYLLLLVPLFFAWRWSWPLWVTAGMLLIPDDVLLRENAGWPVLTDLPGVVHMALLLLLMAALLGGRFRRVPLRPLQVAPYAYGPAATTVRPTDDAGRFRPSLPESTRLASVPSPSRQRYWRS